MEENIKINDLPPTTFEDVNDFENIQEFVPEVLPTPDFGYGNGQNNLDGPIAVRNLAKVAYTGKYSDLNGIPGALDYAYLITTGGNQNIGYGQTPVTQYNITQSGGTSLTAGSSTITVNTTGVYQVTWGGFATSGSVNVFQHILVKNGSNYFIGREYSPIGNAQSTFSLLIPLQANDILRMDVWIEVDTAVIQLSNLGIVRIA